MLKNSSDCAGQTQYAFKFDWLIKIVITISKQCQSICQFNRQ